MIKKIDHIAIAVSNLEEAAKFYEEKLGITLIGEETLPEQVVRVGFLKIGEVAIELVQPLSETSPISKFLSERGPGLHHICFAVFDIEKELTRLNEAGVRLIDTKPRTGAHNTKVGFIHPKGTGGVLIELKEIK